MDQDTADRLWSDLEAVAHDDLRVVTVYRKLDHATRLRDDLQGRYTDEVHRRLVDENIIDWYSEERMKSVLDAGPLEAVIRLYPDFCLIAASRPGQTDRGVLVSIEPPTDAEGMATAFDVVEFLGDLEWDVLDRLDP